MVENNKNFLSIHEQITLLKSRNLIIDKEEKAKLYLKIYNYQSLINGYNDPFLVGFRRVSNKYRKQTYFQNIIDLFEIDRKISEFVLTYIQSFERLLNSAVIYCVCRRLSNIGIKNGKLLLVEEKYWNEIFISNSKKMQQIKNIFNNIFIKASNENLLIKYVNVENTPIWSLFIFADFGSILNFYNLLNTKLKHSIIYFIFGKKNNLSLNQFLSICKVFKNIRNKCCHNNVLYNFSSENSKLKKFMLTMYSIKVKKIRLWHVIKLLDDWIPNKEYSLNSKVFNVLKNYLLNNNMNKESVEFILQNLGYVTKI